MKLAREDSFVPWFVTADLCAILGSSQGIANGDEPKTREQASAAPRDNRPIGDVAWLCDLTGWSHDKVSRLARLKVIKGAFKAQANRGSTWNFHKVQTLAWLKSLGNK